MDLSNKTNSSVRTNILHIRTNEQEKQMLQKVVDKLKAKNVSDAIRKLARKELSKK